MTWRLDPEIREKVEKYDANPFYVPYGDRRWLVELNLSQPTSEIAKHDDGEIRRFESDEAAWHWIEANRGGENEYDK